MKVSKWAWRWQAVDYALILPLLALLPYALAQRLAKLRGAWHARLGRDWAELSVGLRYIADRTAKAAQVLWPQVALHEVVRLRYETVSREEWQGQRLSAHQLSGLNPDLSALKNMLMHASPDRGLVVLTAHFDSFIVGMVGLGLCGRQTSITTSNVYEHAQVHPAVKAFFDRKYRGAEHFLKGGLFMHVETSLRALYKRLRHHQTVVVVADVPATEQGNGTWLPFLKQERKVANGGFRMAQETNSLICAMLCVTQDNGDVSWICSNVYDPLMEPDTETKLFAIFEQHILAHPGKWWAAHLLQDFPTRSAA
jgi:lauroyl/myristoyl acyltransferase